MSKLDELTKLVEKLRKNREAVSVAEREGKYKKAFAVLEKKILECHKATFWDVAFSGLVLYKDGLEEAKQAASELYQKHADKINQAARDALIGRCDLTEYVLNCLEYQQKFEERFYRDYWLQHIKSLGGRFYSDLIDMWYDSEHKLWENADGAFRIAYPPTLEGYEADLQERRAQVAAEIAGFSKKVS